MGKNSRKWLTETELTAVEKACRQTKYSTRNLAIVRLSVRHGLRVSELLNLTWKDVDFLAATIFIERLKGSRSGTHYLKGFEIALLKRVKKLNPTPWIIHSNRNQQMSRENIKYVCWQLGEIAQLPFKLHHHYFRHTCGYLLASKGADPLAIKNWLGHVSIQNTMLYIEGANRFDAMRKIW